MGRYCTPRNANGMSKIIISALKITAERIALWGDARCMMFNGAISGYTPMNMAGMIAKYFATSLAMEKVVSTPRVISICLPISTTSNKLGRIGIEIDHVAGFFGRLRSGVHRHADVGLRQRRRIVGAVAGHRDQFSLGLFFFDEPHFCFRRCLREEIVNAGFARDRRRRARVVAGDHHGANAHGAEALEAFLDAALHHVLQMNHAENFVSLGDHQRRAAGVRNSMGDAFDLRAHRPAQFLNVGGDRIDRALADLAPIEITAAHAGFSAERNKMRADLGHVATAQSVFLLGEHDDRSPFRGFVGQARKLRRVRQGLRAGAVDGNEFGGHAIAQGDRPGLVQVATCRRRPRLRRRARSSPSTFLRSKRSMPAMPMAESNPPMVVGIRQTSNATITVTETTVMPE